MRLAGVLAEAPFPLYGVHPRTWNGPAFVGTVDRRQQIEVVQLAYLDALDASTMGAVVSHIAADAVLEGRVDPVAAHLVPFVTRFEPGFLVRRVKRRRFVAFRDGEFSQKDATLAVAGQTVGAVISTHRELPLQLARLALRRGDVVVDLGVAAWRLDVREFVAKVEPVDVRFAVEFDQASESAYPVAGGEPSGEGDAGAR